MRIIFAILFLAFSAVGCLAQDAAALFDALAAGDFRDREKAVLAVAQSGHASSLPVLEALSGGTLYFNKNSRKVFIVQPAENALSLTDPGTMSAAGEAPKGEFEKIKVNNALRRTIANALSGLTILSPDVGLRRKAVLSVLKTGDVSALEMLESALPGERDANLAALMRQAIAAATLKSQRSEAEKLAAITLLAGRNNQETAALLSAFAATAEGNLKLAAEAGLASIEGSLVRWVALQNIWYGLSLSSVLLLAAIGLAITFGVMGIINMAHGEMIMLGAYTTYVVQGLVAAHLPGAMAYSLVIAVPAAFLVSGGFGVALERSVIRFLYGRPLETLLATWGISLILQQAVRTIFGPTNKEVKTPDWMSGSFELTGGLSFTLNRLAILVFALAVFAGLMLLVRKSAFGLEMRAVTQNRPMASAMGIRSGRVDALTFGLGSGIAGLAGVALSQIDNVSPNLGQSYIIDSFLVVVFGGVGNLWGTLAGAITLGIANKFLEPFAGAVLGKILILVAVILFIQKRPRGLFALKGRWVET